MPAAVRQQLDAQGQPSMWCEPTTAAGNTVLTAAQAARLPPVLVPAGSRSSRQNGDTWQPPAAISSAAGAARPPSRGAAPAPAGPSRSDSAATAVHPSMSPQALAAGSQAAAALQQPPRPLPHPPAQMTQEVGTTCSRCPNNSSQQQCTRLHVVHRSRPTSRRVWLVSVCLHLSRLACLHLCISGSTASLGTGPKSGGSNS